MKWLLLFVAISPEWEGSSPAVRQWFNSPKVAPCCNVADGHRTTWKGGGPPGYQYSVQIDGKWWSVPDSAVIHDAAPMPDGESIVWYVPNWTYSTEGERRVQQGYLIRCFIPGPGA
jgi:hypothetical protein